MSSWICIGFKYMYDKNWNWNVGARKVPSFVFVLILFIYKYKGNAKNLEVGASGFCWRWKKKCTFPCTLYHEADCLKIAGLFPGTVLEGKSNHHFKVLAYLHFNLICKLAWFDIWQGGANSVRWHYFSKQSGTFEQSDHGMPQHILWCNVFKI